MSLIPDTGVMQYPSLHPAVRQYVHLEATGARDATGQNGWYYPVMFVNTFWQLKTHMTTLNSTVTRLPLHINLNNFANWKFSMIASIDEGAKQTARQAAQGQASPGGGDGSEFEMIKEVLLDTNIYLLSTTVVVSIMHMIFEMLAFKSDISHYRNKKNNVGISVRSILGNVFMQGVIFLYLMDNNENTSTFPLLVSSPLFTNSARLDDPFFTRNGHPPRILENHHRRERTNPPKYPRGNDSLPHRLRRQARLVRN
jgi:hypothetical protein